MSTETQSTVKKVFQTLSQNQFLFEELIKRDFKRKYKRTFLGILWSVLSPLFTLLVLKVVFTTFFGRSIPCYTIYLFCGTLLFSFFRESTSNGMGVLLNNAPIFTKINVPKYIFLLANSISALINFMLSLLVFFVFCLLEPEVTFTWKMLLLIYPLIGLYLFNLGVSMSLSALYVFFKDIRYLYDIAVMLLMYLSAIFYSVKAFDPMYQKLFLLNPVYVYISYFRSIVIEHAVPDLLTSSLAFIYPLLVLSLGCLMYKKLNRVFLYYV